MTTVAFRMKICNKAMIMQLIDTDNGVKSIGTFFVFLKKNTLLPLS